MPNIAVPLAILAHYKEESQKNPNEEKRKIADEFVEKLKEAKTISQFVDLLPNLGKSAQNEHKVQESWRAGWITGFASAPTSRLAEALQAVRTNIIYQLKKENHGSAIQAKINSNHNKLLSYKEFHDNHHLNEVGNEYRNGLLFDLAYYDDRDSILLATKEKLFSGLEMTTTHEQKATAASHSTVMPLYYTSSYYRHYYKTSMREKLESKNSDGEDGIKFHDFEETENKKHSSVIESPGVESSTESIETKADDQRSLPVMHSDLPLSNHLKKVSIAFLNNYEEIRKPLSARKQLIYDKYINRLSEIKSVDEWLEILPQLGFDAEIEHKEQSGIAISSTSLLTETLHGIRTYIIHRLVQEGYGQALQSKIALTQKSLLKYDEAKKIGHLNKEGLEHRNNLLLTLAYLGDADKIKQAQHEELLAQSPLTKNNDLQYYSPVYYKTYYKSHVRKRIEATLSNNGMTQEINFTDFEDITCLDLTSQDVNAEVKHNAELTHTNGTVITLASSAEAQHDIEPTHTNGTVITLASSAESQHDTELTHTNGTVTTSVSSAEAQHDTELTHTNGTVTISVSSAEAQHDTELTHTNGTVTTSVSSAEANKTEINCNDQDAKSIKPRQRNNHKKSSSQEKTSYSRILATLPPDDGTEESISHDRPAQLIPKPRRAQNYHNSTITDDTKRQIYFFLYPGQRAEKVKREETLTLKKAKRV